VHTEPQLTPADVSIDAELIKARNEHKAHLPDKEEGLFTGHNYFQE